MAQATEQQWKHRATWPDGRIQESSVHPGKPGQPCLAGMTQFLMRRKDPGVTVVHLVRTDDGEWCEP